MWGCGSVHDRYSGVCFPRIAIRRIYAKGNGIEMYQVRVKLRLNTTKAFLGELGRQLLPMLISPPTGTPIRAVGGTDNKEKLP